MDKISADLEVTSIVMEEGDSVATLLKEIKEGEPVSYLVQGERKILMAKQMIPFGHKLAIQVIPKSEPVMKYGEVIGVATVDIQPGEHVHVHNIEGVRGRGDIKGGMKHGDY